MGMSKSDRKPIKIVANNMPASISRHVVIAQTAIKASAKKVSATDAIIVEPGLIDHAVLAIATVANPRMGQADFKALRNADLCLKKA